MRAVQVDDTDYYDIEELIEAETNIGVTNVWEVKGRYNISDIDSEVLSLDDNISNLNDRKTEIKGYKNLISAIQITI